MKIVLASNNQGKLQELTQMFGDLPVQWLTQGSLGIGEAPEPFNTFIENALSKARFASAGSGLPALADDAGLCVDAFSGAPGVQTAFYATQFGYAKGDDNNVRALLEQMQNIENRRATLVSTLVAVRSPQDPEPLVAVGRVTGLITREPKGTNGFGFDPVMWIERFGKTFAQLSVETKNAISHRGQASKIMRRLIEDAWLGAGAASESSEPQPPH